jgi:hypothetical protein
MTRTTYQDAILHLVDYLGANPSEAVQRDCRRAIQEAYRDLANAQRWLYLIRHGRIITSTPYPGFYAQAGCPPPTGPQATVTYLQSSGAYPRQVTLVNGVWPAWAAGGYLRASENNTPADLGLVAFRCAQRISDTVLTLDDEVNPGSDITTPTYFCLYQDTYLLPEDYIGNDQTLYERNFGGMDYVHPREWLFENRYVFAEGVPMCYTITGDPQYPGRMVLRVMPFPSETKSIDFVYHRRPRPMLISNQTVGTVSLTAGSTTITGTGTTWSPSLVGSVIRVSGIAKQPPTSIVGDNPAILEGTILSVGSTTSMVVDCAADLTIAGMPSTIADPIDIEDGAMLNAFWRCCEMHVAYGRTLKDKPAAGPLYKQALVEAKQADSRSFAQRVVGEYRPFRQRLRDMPINLTCTE